MTGTILLGLAVAVLLAASAAEGADVVQVAPGKGVIEQYHGPGGIQERGRPRPPLVGERMSADCKVSFDSG